MKARQLVSQACDACKKSKKRCDGGKICSRCSKFGITCEYNIENGKRGRKPGKRKIGELDASSLEQLAGTNIKQLLMLNSSLSEELKRLKQRVRYWEEKYYLALNENNPGQGEGLMNSSLTISMISQWLDSFHQHIHPAFEKLKLPTEEQIFQTMNEVDKATEGQKLLNYVILAYGAKINKHKEASQQILHKLNVLCETIYCTNFPPFQSELEVGLASILLTKFYFPNLGHLASRAYLISQYMQTKRSTDSCSEMERAFHFRALCCQMVMSTDDEDQAFLARKAKRMQPANLDFILFCIFLGFALLKKQLTRERHSRLLSLLDSAIRTLDQLQHTEIHPRIRFFEKLWWSLRMVCHGVRALSFYKLGNQSEAVQFAQQIVIMSADNRFSPFSEFSGIAITLGLIVCLLCNQTVAIEQILTVIKNQSEVMPIFSPLAKKMGSSPEELLKTSPVNWLSELLLSSPCSLLCDSPTPEITACEVSIQDACALIHQEACESSRKDFHSEQPSNLSISSTNIPSFVQSSPESSPFDSNLNTAFNPTFDLPSTEPSFSSFVDSFPSNGFEANELRYPRYYNYGFS